MILHTITKSSIVRAEVYYNENCAKTMEQIQKELGCQYMINTTLFNMITKKAAGWLHIDGKKIAEVANPYGLAVNGNKIVFSYGNNVNYPDFTGCYHVLVRDGKIAITQSESDSYGYTDRSCIGIKANGDLVFLADQSNRSLMGVAGDMLNAGCITALNFDGGGSVQCYNNGLKLTSSRKVIAYLCVWTEDVKEDDNEENKEENDMLKVLLIAGHGAGDSGAVSGNWQEATETRNVVKMLSESLKNICEVSTYPTTQNAYTDYKNGKLNTTANFKNYDYVLEVHFNAVSASSSDGKTKGVECYVTTSESGIGVEEAICKNIATVGLTNRGVKRYNWAVINQAKQAGTSSALLEVCFIDDPDDMQVYSTKQKEIVMAIANGIKSGFSLTGNVVDPAPTAPEEPEIPDQSVTPDKADAWAQVSWQKAYDKIGTDGNRIMNGENPKNPISRQDLTIVLDRLGLLD